MQAPPRGSGLKAHLAKVAADLFYREGIHAVGVDRIADEARVTKRTLYHHYRSKEELIAAALLVSPIIEFPAEGTPAERILGAFERLGEFLTGSDYRGCPYIIFTAELVRCDHPARHIIERRVAKRRAWFRDLAAQAGAKDPDLLADELDVLFDGALASGAKSLTLKPAKAAIAAARTLLASACQKRRAAAASAR